MEASKGKLLVGVVLEALLRRWYRGRTVVQGVAMEVSEVLEADARAGEHEVRWRSTGGDGIRMMWKGKANMIL